MVQRAHDLEDGRWVLGQLPVLESEGLLGQIRLISRSGP